MVDEAAHVEGLEELWTGLYPTLYTGGRCIALSTPNGVGNWFHKTYIEAAEGENDFKTTCLSWDVHPDRDMEWFEKETKNMSRREIAQELECNFNTSGETVIHPDYIERIKGTICEPKHRTGFDRNFWIWEEYDPKFSYLLVADVARGDGADSSTFHILKLETMEFVAEYQGKPNLDMYSIILNNAGREYGNCLLVVENNSLGIAILEKLKDLEYPNIYFSIKSTHEYVEQYQAEALSNSVPGFTTSSKTRPLIIAKLEEFIRNKIITVYSSRFLHEMTTFIWNNGKPQAMRGYNDDLVLAAAIACWVKDTALEVSERDIEYTKAFLSSVSKASSELNNTIYGMHGFNKGNNLDKKLKEYHQQSQQFPWIFKG